MIKKIHFTTLAKCRFISMKLIRDPARDTEAIVILRAAGTGVKCSSENKYQEMPVKTLRSYQLPYVCKIN